MKQKMIMRMPVIEISVGIHSTFLQSTGKYVHMVSLCVFYNLTTFFVLWKRRKLSCWVHHMDIISSLHLDFTLKNSFRITSFSTEKCVCIRKLVTIKKSKRRNNEMREYTWECQSLNYYTLNSISITDESTERGTNDPTNWMEISTRGIILSLPCCDIVHWLMSLVQTTHENKKK